MRPPEQAAYSSDNCPSFCTIIVPPNTSFFALFLDIWGNRDFNSFVTFKLMIDPKKQAFRQRISVLLWKETDGSRAPKMYFSVVY